MHVQYKITPTESALASRLASGSWPLRQLFARDRHQLNLLQHAPEILAALLAILL